MNVLRLNTQRGIDLGIIGILLISLRSADAAEQPTFLVQGTAAFQEHRWMDAMADFLVVLEHDPKNAQAHAYVNLTVKEIEAQHRALVQQERLALLQQASRGLSEKRQDDRKVEMAISDMTGVEERTRRERWQRWCEEAKTELQLGHLLAANDLVLRVIAENPNDRQAQQVLSDLQSTIHQSLESGTTLLVQERYALEGFYAYGQADYATATTAWDKARTIVQQTYPSEEAIRQIASLHFESYAQQAQTIVDEAKRKEAIRARFARGVDFYQKGRYAQALEIFREVALADPQLPQLAAYLVQAEGGAEKERTRLLSEEKRQRIAHVFEKGLAAMEHEEYAQAEQSFQSVLVLDPTHPQAHSYLTAVQAEIQRRHDPQAAQAHYEAGLIAYASGKLDEAAREWRIASRMDPQNEKAVNALAKVQKELAFSNEVP